jgi:hypothetical protein
MPEQNSPDLRDTEPKHDPRQDADGMVTQRLALLAIFAVAVLAVLAFAYVL